MILNRVRVEGYQVLRNPVELDGLGLGLHVIHGPNTTGKSTLIAAIARAFFDRYSTSDQEMRSLRPWGTELAPRVTLEFEARGKRYRLDKKFLDEESSALSEWSGSRFERMADSTKADDQIRDILFATAAAKGAAGLDNWGLARLLWMTQHSSRLSPPGLDETLRQRLLSVLGSAVLSDAEQAFLTRLDEAYDIYYTAAKQSEKRGSPLAEARERLQRAEQELARWKTKWDDVTRLGEAAAEAEGRLAHAVRERGEAETAIRELRARAGKELELENRIKLKEQEVLRAQGRWKEVSLLQGELRSTESLIRKKEEEVLALEPREANCVSSLKTAEAALEAGAEALKNATEENTRLARQLSAAAVLSELENLRRNRSELSGLLTHASEIETRRAAKGEAYRAKKRPKETELGEARSLSQETQALAKRIEDLGIEVRFTPEREGLQAVWKTAGVAGPATALTLGETAIFRSSDSGELHIPGVGVIQVRSGSEDSRGLKVRLSETQSKLAAKLSHFGVATLEELVSLRAETAEIESEGQALRQALDSALNPRFKSISELTAEVERVEKRLQDCLNAQLDRAPLAAVPELAQLDLAQLDRALNQARSAQEQAQRAKSALEAESLRLRTELETVRSGLESARQARTLLRTQLETKLSASGGAERVEIELREAVLAKNSLESELEVFLKLMPPLQDRASAKLSLLERRLEEVQLQEQQARQDHDRKSAVLLSEQGEGYYSKLAAAEEERALASELLQSRLSQAQGAKVLRTLAHNRRTRMNSGLMAPIESAVSRIFEKIHGPMGPVASNLSFGADVGELGVKIAAVAAGKRAGESSPLVNLESLSYGTREQAMLAVRLAFGELLSEQGNDPEPQLIVLDDPLVNADEGRQARALEVLGQAAKKLQILVFTARPENFRALNPKEYDLAALKERTI